jgi:hypothetical protein
LYPRVTNAALAMACEAVGEEIKINIAIAKSLKKDPYGRDMQHHSQN